MHEVLVNSLGGLSLPGKSVARLIDRPNMTIAVYHGHITTTHNCLIQVRVTVPKLSSGISSLGFQPDLYSELL